MLVLPVHDRDRLESVLRDDPEIAAVILEPTGAGYSSYPLDPDFLAAVRKLTLDYGVLMIMDEVITGFRCSPGGAQAATGVIPDLTSLAKILAGGLPGGAVAGRADILAHLEYRDEPGWNARKKVRHQGTFNANPLSASAGTTALSIVAEGWPARHVNDLAALLRAEFNQSWTPTVYPAASTARTPCSTSRSTIPTTPSSSNLRTTARSHSFPCVRLIRRSTAR